VTSPHVGLTARAGVMCTVCLQLCVTLCEAAWLPVTVRNIHSTAVYKRAAVGTAWPLLGWPSNGQAVSGLLRKLMVSHIVKKFNLQNKRSLCSYDVLFETDCKRSVMSAESSPRTAVTAVRIPLLYSRKVTSQFRRDS